MIKHTVSFLKALLALSESELIKASNASDMKRVMELQAHRLHVQQELIQALERELNLNQKLGA
jgi:hypothetical protein